MRTTTRGAKLLEAGDYVNAAFSNEDSAFNTNAALLDTHIGGTLHATQPEKDAWNAKAEPVTVQTLVLPVTGWEGTGPYHYTAALAGMTANRPCVAGLPAQASPEQTAAARAMGLQATAQAAGEITLSATALPTAALTVAVWLF